MHFSDNPIASIVRKVERRLSESIASEIVLGITIKITVGTLHRIRNKFAKDNFIPLAKWSFPCISMTISEWRSGHIS